MARLKMRLIQRHFLVFCVIILLSDITSSDSASVPCNQQCGQSDLVEGDSWHCNLTCRMQKCADGCKLWKNALADNCLQACSKLGLSYNEQQYCSTGCNIAIDNYAQIIKQEIGGLSKPTLLAGSRTNHSVLLNWDFPSSPSAVSPLQYKVQIDYVEHPVGWQYHDAVQTQNHHIRVTHLRPHVSYKFRILVVITSRHSVISPESFPIATTPYGAPSSPPTILSLSSSATSIHARWKPPVFINGMLTNYRFEVTPVNPSGSEPSKLKEIVVFRGNAPMSEVMTLLRPETEYRVSIKAVNPWGAGPGLEMLIKTQPESIEGITPFLVLGGDHKILRGSLDDKFGYPEELYRANNTSNLVLGVSIDYARRLIYFSDVSMRVWQLNVTRSPGRRDGGGGRGDDDGGRGLRLVYESREQPRNLAMDWLHQKLYITEDRHITECDLLSWTCTPVITKLSSRPEDVKVDPCNGYLYWTQHGLGRGLFRIDLADLTRPDIRLAGGLAQYLIVSIDMLTTLCIDYLNYRLFLPDESNNTIQSYYLDGNDKYDIRTNTQKSEYIAVKSIVYYNGIFIWVTQGSEKETTNIESITQGKVYINEMPMFSDEQHFAGLNIWHPTAQPVPVPLLPPKKLQAIFSATTALIQWNETESDQGRGAWREWLYELEVCDLSTLRNHTYSDLNSTALRVQRLKVNTLYQIRVRAYSSGGYGPWSDGFRGATIKDGGVLPTLAVVGEAAIYQVPLDGEPVHAILNHTVLTGVKDLELYKDELLWSMDSGVIYRKRRDQPIRILQDINNAGAIAYDWLAKTLYWASITHTNMILRSVLSSPLHPETVIQELAGFAIQDITLDPVEGFIYWTTLHSIGASRLDGSEYNAIVNVMPNFSGKYILGLALDSEKGFLYWLEKDVDIMVLYCMGLLRRNSYSSDRNVMGTSVVHSFASKTMYQSIQLYSDKLFWQILPEEMMVLDIRGKSLAHMDINTPGERFTTFAIRHPSMYRYPPGLNETTTQVVPAAVDPASVHVDGDWNLFNISWHRSSVNHGQVYYKLLMAYTENGRQKEVSRETQDAYIIVNHPLSPYTTVVCTIKACTHWGCSPPSNKSFTTPMAAPSPPQRPRVFVTHHQDYRARGINIQIDFRWDPPARPNGVISGYYVQYSINGSAVPPALTRNGITHHTIDQARHNSRYTFKVRACTVIECGNYTRVVQSNTKVEHPAPTLLTTTPNAIRLFYPDERKTQELTEATGATSIAFIAHESTIYWLDKRGYIMKRIMTETKEVVAVDTRGRDLTADWIGRDLYWLVQKDKNISNIMKYDLNKNSGKPILVLTRVTVLWKMAMNPYQSTLYWTETNPDGIGTMMTCKKDGTGVRPLLRGRRRRKNKNGRRRKNRKRNRRALRHRREQEDDGDEDYEYCNCPELSVSPVFVMDHTDRDSPEIFLVDQQTNSIWGADLDGCQCRVIINASLSMDLGLPPDSLTVDHERIYWSNADERVVNSVMKADGGGFSSEATDDVNNIIAYGEHLQPMPDTACLMLDPYTSVPVMVASTNTTIQLRFQETFPPLACNAISMPSVKHSVHYREIQTQADQRTCDNPAVACDVQSSFDTLASVVNLKPYTMYLMQVAVSNFYMDSMNIKSILSPHGIFWTKAGIPSAPLDVAADPSTPTTANVTWRMPAHTHGLPGDIIYVVDWRTTNSDGSESRGKVGGGGDDDNIERPLPSNMAEQMYMIVGNLNAGQKYFFTVLASDSDRSGFSASSTVSAVMFQYPGAIRLLERRQTSLVITWTSPSDDSISRHGFEYTKVGLDLHWSQKALSDIELTTNYTQYNQTFNRLQANQEYAFRTVVIYKKHFQHFIWPSDSEYIFKTAADVPWPPSPPMTRTMTSGMYMVVWEEPQDGGAPIIAYHLQARLADDIASNWSTVYNGSDDHWQLTGLEEAESYTFRVQALNKIGWSNFSDNSSSLEFAAWMQAPASGDRLTVILASCFSVIVLLIVGAIVIFGVVCMRRYKDHKMIPGFHLVAGLRGAGGADMELATLRELPRVTRQQANALYAINIVPTKEDIAALPHFRRDQLTLTKFLGSGAFGEVFEGVAKNIISDTSGETKVAVKTLRKGASDQEKEEFLKEALLMSNFKHEHILRLLGVCLDNDPQFIILELMEGGDLLSYLRNARATPSCSAKLFLPGMVGICVDVSKGCRYLEDMHFVHRDLAARNCLVSNGYRERVVKIGDFGLARDIYKNDYYRKEGEGLLPVRWMSPESLIDGVFTTQSDVWAFGVLMWEVLTLGQQPYPARTNIEVLHFVRSGGRLDRPEICPDEMYSLMYKCWMYNPEDRPSFHYILEQLEHFKELCSDPNSEFSGLVPIAITSGKASYAYVLERNSTHIDQSDDSVSTPSENRDSCHEQPQDDASNINRPPTRKERLMAFLTGGSDSEGTPAPTPPMKKTNAVRHSPPFDMRSRVGKEDANGYLEPLVQPQDKHKYLELLESNKPKPSSPGGKKTRTGLSPMMGTNGPGKNVTYAQLAGSEEEEDPEGKDNGARQGKYDRTGRIRNPMSPPKEQAPPVPPGGGARFVVMQPDVRSKMPGGGSDLSGLGTNHWPQNNIPALPLPPPRECKFLRDPQTERRMKAVSRFDRNGKRRSSSLNSRPMKREEREEAREVSADEDSKGSSNGSGSSGGSGGGGRIYPSRSELRKNPFVEDVGPRSGRGRGPSRSQSAGRGEGKTRPNGLTTKQPRLPLTESDC